MTDPADVLVVGHATIDVVRVPGRPDVERPGGVALYAGVAAARLGARTVVLTRSPAAMAVRWLELAAEAGAELVVRPSPTPTRFVHEHPAGPGTRRLRVTSVASPFLAEDLRMVRAHAILLGPLLPGDLDTDVVAEARGRTDLLAIGAQGLVRSIDEDGVVGLRRPVDLSWLDALDVVACDTAEAAALTGQAEPAKAAKALAHGRPGLEVLVTAAARGVFIALGDTEAHVPSIAPRRHGSSTGAGDTLLAAYLVARVQGRTPIDAARFASAAASLSLEHDGPLRAGRAVALARAAEAADPRA